MQAAAHSKHSMVRSLLISECLFSHQIFPISGVPPVGLNILAHLQSWHLLLFSDTRGTKQDTLLCCPIAILRLLHQTVPGDGRRLSGVISRPYLHCLQV